MSMPRRAHFSPRCAAGISRALLGRSRTCPMEASIRKPFPRNFPIVFALAGDSTITSGVPSGLGDLDFTIRDGGTSRRPGGWGDLPRLGEGEGCPLGGDDVGRDARPGGA